MTELQERGHAAAHERGHATTVGGALTVGQMLDALADSTAELTLVDQALTPQRISGRALGRAARRAAAALEHAGVRPGDRVFLVSSTSLDFLISLFGVWRAGAVPVVMSLPRTVAGIAAFPAEISARMATVEARMLIVADAFLDAAPQLGKLADVVLRCGDVADPTTPETVRPPTSDPSGVAHLQFTSGTTGAAKAVMITHGQLLRHAGAMWGASRFSDRQVVFVGWLPWYHDMGLVAGIATLSVGGHLVLMPPEDFLSRPAAWMEAIAQYRGQATAAPNFAYALAAQALEDVPDPLDLSSLELAGNGAEPIDGGVLQAFAQAGARHGLRDTALCPMYGLAEATLAVTIDPSDRPHGFDVVSRASLELEGRAAPVEADDPDARVLARCGRALAGVELVIRDPDGAPLPERQVGEITVTGPFVTPGFWGEPDATRAMLRDGWLHTGDLGYMVGDELVVCGRSKDMVIAAGRNLYPEDYEAVARSVDGVRPVVAAFSLPGFEHMIVVAERRAQDGDAARLATEVMRAIVDVLSHPAHRVIIVPKGTIPRTSSGKTQRGATRDLLMDGELAVDAEVGR